ncbi:amino acid adenylation domain-containing protein, partial [Streptomyces bauhiniae]
ALAAAGPFSFVKLTPGHLDLLTHQLDAEQARSLAGVVIAAGDNFPVSLAERWRKLAGPQGTKVATEYGPTEITIGNSGLVIDELPVTEAIPLGAPIPNTQMYVLTDALDPAPIGVAGEVYIAGTGLARGYLGRPDLTAEKFLPNPYGQAGSRLYRTGDLARFLPDGTLETLGRIDNQVKIRGYRIELGEIEARLREHPHIQDAVTTVRQSGTGEKSLVGYLVPGDGTAVDTTAVRSHLTDTLPDYMVPSAFVTITRIPLTTNGKVDHRALPAPDLTAFAGAEQYVAPRTPVEEKLAAIWQDVLGLDRVGVEDSFFDLGGDSIRAVRLVGALRAAGYDLSIPDVFQLKTIAALATRLGGHESGESLITVVQPFAQISDVDRAALPAGVTDAYPLSQVQTGMLVEMLASGDDDAVYQNINSFRIPDTRPFSAEAMRGAVDTVVARHDILRTTMHLDGYSQPLQLVHGTVEIPLTMHDLRGLTGEERTARSIEYVEAEHAAGFKLANGPLLRIAVHLEEDDAWRLTFSHIHATTDGWTVNSLLMELLDVYRALRDGQEPAAYEAPAVRYADFIAAEQASLAAEGDQAYWQDVIAAHTPLTLPDSWAATADGPGEPFGHRVSFADLEGGLKRLAAESKSSLKSVLLAAHLKVLGTLTADPAFHTGVVYHGRLEAPGADRVLGMHLNTLPFPAVQGARTWRELVERVYARETEIWSHRRYPLPAIQRATGGGSGELLPVAFEFHDFHQVDADSVDVGATKGAGSNEFALSAIASAERITLGTSTRFLDRAGLARLAGMYRRVLEAMAADLDGDATGSFLSDAERVLLLDEWNSPAEFPVDRSVHELFADQAARTPDAVALTSGETQLTYRQLDESANRLAHHLIASGVGPETIVGVSLERGPDLVPALLGVLKSGAAYLPLDPVNPAERLAYMLSDARATVLVTHSALPELEFTGTRVLVDTDAPAIAGRPVSAPETAVRPDNLMYVIYTSGSTGLPKGVSLTHGNVVRLYPGMGESFVGFSADDVWMLLHSYAFDVSVWEMWGALLHGGRLVVVPPDVSRSPDELLDLMVRERVTTLFQTPSAFRGIAAAATAGDPRIGQLALRLAGFGGERIEPAEFAPWVAARGLDSPVLVNLYGPTETTVQCAFHPLGAQDLGEVGRSVIGRPLADLSIHLLDPDGELVPVGVPGELCVGGPALARGYLGRPGLTAERFVPNPFGPAGSRLYRTGDLARFLPDGSIDFLGRIDKQVKVRGYRIELGEIETRLREHSSVRGAVVIVHEPAPGDQRLAAYVVPAEDAELRGERLRAHLAQALPEYMVPASYTAIERVPLTANGKVDVRALPEPDPTAHSSAEYVAPRNPVEERLAAVWAEVLGLERVGVEDSFFDLGGDSMRVVTLVGALRAAGLDLSIPDVFRLRTVAALAGRLDGRSGGDGGSLIAAVAPYALIGEEDQAALPAGVVDAYPLTQVQTGMLIELMTADGDDVYHSINSFRIPDTRPFDEEAMRGALATVAARHDILRTSVHLDGYSQPLQLVHAEAGIPLIVHDLRGLSTEQQDRRAQEYVEGERAAGFELTAAPLLRIAAHIESADAWRLTASHLHAVTDGWTLNSLLMELLDVYRALRDGREPAAYEAPAVRYADYVAAEQAALSDAGDQAFWQAVVDEHSPLTLPAAWAGDGGHAERHGRRVPFADLEEGLRGLATEARTSMKSVLLAAHLKVLGLITQEEAFHTGIVHHGRLEAPGSDRVLGMHLNTLPFPVVKGARTWAELVEGVYRQETEMWSHRRYPLPAIQRATGSTGRLISVIFDHQNFHQVDTDTVDVRASLGDGGTEFPLSVVASNGHIALNTTADVLTRGNLERLGTMYRLVLEAMATDPHGEATAVHLPPAERESLLASGAARTTHQVSGTVHEAFARQAARTPDAGALTSDGTTLTYRELNERANRIAHRLIALGVGPDTVVGVTLDRDADLVPALIGVLKSGAAYLPLDPANPAERLTYMLADAKTAVLVGQSAHAARLTGAFDGPTVLLDDADDAALLAAQPAHDPVTPALAQHLACVICTSGSTGMPKGVAVPHGNILRMFAAMQERMDFSAGDVCTQSHSYAFDFCVQEMWSALLHGGRLVMVPPLVGRSPDDLLDLLVAEQITVLCQIPSAFRGLAALAGAGDPRIDRLALRAIVFGGERLDVTELRPWLDRVGLERTMLVNEYGPTEITVHCTAHVLRPEDLDDPARSVLGRNIDDLSVHLLDPAGHLVPVGVPGELYVGGPGVTRGYLDRPELTAERFVPDPFGPVGARLYRTGDLGRRQGDGTIEFLGRADNQIKIRGYRVELGEIEAALREHAELEDAIVTVRTNEEGEKSLVAYVVGHGPGVAPAALRRHLAATLADYMIPSAFVALDALPLNPSGKINFGALPAPDRTASAGAAHVAPRNPVEERLAAIWGEVLDLSGVGVEDSFFDLGGDSMRAVRLVGALRAAGYDVSIPDVFELKTVASIAAQLVGQGGRSLVQAVEPFALIGAEDRGLLPDGVVDAYPLSQVQTGMLVEMLATASPHGRSLYHNVNSFKIRDERPFSLDALQKAVDIVVARHDILRTSMHLEDFSRPLQLVHATAPYPVRMIDLRDHDGDELLALKREYLGREQHIVFDLTEAPLMRVSALVESDDGWRLNFTYNHAISEGWSYNALMMEVLEAYRCLRDGREPVPYQAPAVRYADFIAAELASLDSLDDQTFWRTVVAEHAPVAIPASWAAADAVPKSHGTKVPFTDLEEGLRRLAGEAMTSMKSVLLAAHLKVLGMLTADGAFHTGVVYHGRLEAPGADRVLGMHLNTLPFPLVKGARTWRELVAGVYRQETEIWSHRRHPLPAIQRAAGNSRDLLHILFEYLDFHHVDTDTVDVAEGLNDGVNEFSLNVIPNKGTFHISTSTAVLSRDNLELLGQMYRMVLESMAADPDGDAAANYLPDTAPGQSCEPEPAGRDRVPVDALVASRAAADPRATAVVAGEDRLTYGELAERANRIAHHLIAAGAAPDVPVAVCLDAGADLVPTLYGIWKAGTAYLPLDPALPAERIAALATAAGAALLVTDSAHAGRTGGFTGTRVLLDTERAAIEARPATAPDHVADPDRPAWVSYGPNGTDLLTVTHRQLAERVEAGLGVLGTARRAAWLVPAAEPAERLHLALASGARVVLAGRDTAGDAQALVEFVDRQRITHVQATPETWRELLAAGFDNYAVTALVGGGSPTADLVGGLLDRTQRLIAVQGAHYEELEGFPEPAGAPR